MMLEIRPAYPDTQERIGSLLEELATLQRRPLLCVYHDQAAEESIGEECLAQVRKLAPSLAEYRKVSVLLDSPGGDIESAYRMLNVIRRYVDELDVLVPGWAKSAATFFCLGADKIHLGPDGELGPLDPQLRDPRGRARLVTPLETFQALEQLRTYSMGTLDAIIMTLLRGASMDIPNAIQQAPPFMSAMIGPLYQQVHPDALGEAGRYLQISEEYAKRVMRRWGYAKREEIEIMQITRTLVWEYPTHGFVIDLPEAIELGLNVDELDANADYICQQILHESTGCIGLVFPKTGSLEESTSSGEAENGEPSQHEKHSDGYSAEEFLANAEEQQQV